MAICDKGMFYLLASCLLFSLARRLRTCQRLLFLYFFFFFVLKTKEKEREALAPLSTSVSSLSCGLWALKGHHKKGRNDERPRTHLHGPFLSCCVGSVKGLRAAGS